MLITPQPSRFQRIYLDDVLKVDVPFFGADHLPEDYCARFARLCSHLIFGKDFPVAHAWQMREKTRAVATLTENSQLVQLVRIKTVIPGMLLGVYSEDSLYNPDGLRSYTHIGVYLGQQSGKPLILEQFGDEVRIIDLQGYKLEGLFIKEILDLRS